MPSTGIINLTSDKDGPRGAAQRAGLVAGVVGGFHTVDWRLFRYSAIGHGVARTKEQSALTRSELITDRRGW